jgi:hypothetical protein
VNSITKLPILLDIQAPCARGIKMTKSVVL